MTTPQLDQGQTAGEATVESRAERDVLRELGFPVAPEAPDGAMEPSGPGPAAPARVDQAKAASSGDGPRVRRRRGRRRGASLRVRFTEDDRGAVTAEYALVIMAAVAFAGLLIVIMRSAEVRAMLLALVQNALGSAG